jgi:formamidopyrimidine-DNA glycosylase
MPELPEVQTIVNELNRKVIGRRILDAWTDPERPVKTGNGASWPWIAKGLKGKKILRVHRRAKYIMMDLFEGRTFIVHQKISGHLLYGKWEAKGRIATPIISGPIKDDKYNSYIRLILYLDNGFQIALSDLRRFARVYLGDTEKIENINEIGKLGPEPLDPKFKFHNFKELMAQRRGVIKKVLMDPFVISGIGNIYSDEILWFAGIHPMHRVEKLTEPELKAIYKYIGFVLKKAIGAHGDSMQDFRTLEGKFGDYQNQHKAYQLTGEKCQKRDGGIITRLKINGRSAHYCPIHQK